MLSLHPTFPHHRPQRQQLAFSRSEKKLDLRNAFYRRSQSFRCRVRRCRRRYALSLRPFGRVSVAAVSDTPSVVSRAVNVLKGKPGAQPHATPSWDDDSHFDNGKEKTNFRQYDEACDRVKEFYREQHGAHLRQSL